MFDFKANLINFFNTMSTDTVEIYNEFSLQHELGIYLRNKVGKVFKIEFERPVSHFNLMRSSLVKKEIDISVFLPNFTEKYAFELKYPRNGQYPEQMFKACQDICFLEQLHQSGFSRCYFVIMADDPLFYSGANQSGIYRHFRASVPVHGYIHKPTGVKNETLSITGNYTITWSTIKKSLKYSVVEIG